MALGGREHVELDAADKQRVGRLFDAERLEMTIARYPCASTI